MSLIAPHGSDELQPCIVDEARAQALTAEAANLPQLLVSSAAAANAVMLAAGYFSPLSGYMNRADTLSVAESMTTTSGLFFPVPVVNLTESFDGSVGDRVALLDPNVDGNPLLAVKPLPINGKLRRLIIKATKLLRM